MPPGQWATPPGLVVKPGVPPQGASVRLMVRSVPALLVTRMIFAWRNNLIPRFTLASRSLVGSVRSKISGCSLQIVNKRVPAASIAGHSSACSNPSTVTSTTMSAAFKASTTWGICWIASQQPVDFTGTGAVLAGVGRIMVAYWAFRLWQAKAASCAITGRDWVSARMATTVPFLTPLRVSTR